jgi:predicted DNA-binding transcriptional regulator AlpA
LEDKVYANTEPINIRTRRTLELFSLLPDDAMLDVRVVSIILNRSVASIWRDAKCGRLANPIRIGARSTRWRVGDVRNALRGADQMLPERRDAAGA